MYNFPGSDTSATLSGFADDAVYRWLRRQDDLALSLKDLADVLTDDLCGTCSGKQYFHTSTNDTLARLDRLQLLLHNWRTANFVNNPSLAEGQYGYPLDREFKPWRDIGCWQNLDGERHDDAVAVPPQVTLTRTGPTSAIHRSKNRFDIVSVGDTVSYPMRVMMFGSEYWVVRSDTSLASGADLVVTVEAESLLRKRPGTCDGSLSASTTTVGRLMASVVGYTDWSESLWAHPELAEVDTLMKPQWVDLDSVSSRLEFIVSGFGSSRKAALVVISLADGNGKIAGLAGPLGLGDFAGVIADDQTPYRVEFAVRRPPYQSQNPMTVASSGGAVEDSPTWSPSGNAIAYQADSASTSTLKRKNLLNGAILTMTTGKSPDWSPGGNLIAFVKDSLTAESRVWLYDTLTSSASQLTVRSGVTVSPVFSPNGQHIAYARAVQDFGSGNWIEGAGVTCVPCGWELRRVDVSGANDTLLLRLYGEHPMQSVRWSPEGQWVYVKKTPTTAGGYPGAPQLWVVSRFGTQAIVKTGMAEDATTFDLHPGAGEILLGQGGGYLWRCGSGTETMPFERIALRDTLSGYTRTHGYVTGATFTNPRWSPDGTRVAYSSDRNTANVSSDRDLFVGQTSYDHAPEFPEGLGDALAYVGHPFGMLVSATDSDNESLTYSTPSAFLPSGATFYSSYYGSAYLAWASPGPVCSENYVVVRAVDGSSGVVSRVVKITAVIDSVDDLNADLVGDDQVWLTWHAPGDNGTLGRGVEYDLRYAQTPLSDVNWGSGTKVNGMSSPATSGSVESQTVTSLSAGTTYYFAIKTKDAKDNWSLRSDLVEVTTTSGGGGGTERAHQVLPGLAGRRMAAPGLNRPGLGAGDQVLSVEMRLDSGAPVWTIRDLSAEEITALGAIDTLSVLLQSRDEAGSWSTCCRIGTAEAAWRLAVRALRQPGRIVFIGPYGLRQAWSQVGIDGRPGAANLVSAHNTRLGSLTEEFDSTGTARLTVTGTDTLSLSYELLTQGSEMTQDWFFLVGPSGSEVNAPLHRKLGVQDAPALPTAFALRQNRPNPFSGVTAIHFDLPAETKVRLEIFDAQGRWVRTLANGLFPPGFHSLQWDHRAEGGHGLGAGVYLYRIQAGDFRAQRKMVLLGR